MRNVFIFVLFFSTQAVWADCYEKLTKNFSQDSASFHVYADFNEGTSSVENAKVLVARTLKQVGCNPVIKFSKVTCARVVPNMQHTEVCYLEADIGYFFASKDYVDTANVTFNRWD